MVQYSNRAKTCRRSEKDGTILKQSQTLSPVRKRWYNTQTVPKPANSQKKIVEYSISSRTCQQSEKDGTILKQSQNLSPVRKAWYKTETVQKPVTSQKKWYNTQIEPKSVNGEKKMVQFSNSGKTC